MAVITISDNHSNKINNEVASFITLAQWFLHAYATILYSIFSFGVRLLYNDGQEFSSNKHDKMIRFNEIAEKVFNFTVNIINSASRYSYTMITDFQNCRLIIRPFIFSEVVMVSGRWEPYVKEILDKQTSKSDVVVDVGANIGIYAVPLAQKVKKVIAFEPHPKTSEILTRNVELNRLTNLVVIKRPVDDSRRNVMYGLSSVPQESGIVDKTNKKVDSTIESESIDLDSALQNENKIDWLLIDVEGFELNVLSGAREIIRKHSPRIIFESYPHNIESVTRMLNREGYSVRQIYKIYFYATKKR